MIEASEGEPTLYLKLTGDHLTRFRHLLLEVRRRDDIANYEIAEDILGLIA